MSNTQRWLTLWVALAMGAGIYLGATFPTIFVELSNLQIGSVNLPIAALIWIMIFPMMLHIDLHALAEVRREPKGLLLTLFINWLVKPFTMALIALFFFNVLYAGLVPPDTANEYIAGMILLGVAPCTAMVFVWSQLTKGDPNYTLVQVSINDVILVFAFAPITAFLLGISDIIVPWTTLIAAVVLYLVIPLVAGLIARTLLLAKSQRAFNEFTKHIEPFGFVGLILTVCLLFGFQANTVLDKRFDIALIAIPLTLQSIGIFAITYGLAKWLRLRFAIAAPASMIGTSNFFELAVAVAIALFGLDSGAVLATVVGVLVEVPVMLLLVHFANKTKHWFRSQEAKTG